MMTIKPAKDFDAVRRFYHSLIDELEGAEYGPGWEKEVYPADEYMRGAIDRGELYIGTIGERIAAAMIVNGDSNDGYAKVSWPTKTAQDEIAVIHILAVHPDFGRRGYAKEMVGYAIAAAERMGRKAVRLDVLKGNLPAERLYTAMGFKYVDTVEMYYEDTGWTDYELYEYTAIDKQGKML